MSSFIYFYSKFTDEFLLLNSTLLFGLSAIYCYHWVVKRRRLGSVGQHVPAGVVNLYLNQLINEAQFVRTHLFGILNQSNNTDGAQFKSLMNHNASASASNHHENSGETGKISDELMQRLNSLENQLSEKEGVIVNINVEKTKLLQEIEALKAKQKSGAPVAAASGNNDELLKRIKQLEQQLEEYSLFEEDLANIKRIQQENEQLKKRIEEATRGAPAAAATFANQPEATSEAILTKPDHAPSLDQAAIDALLDGSTPIPPQIVPQKEATLTPTTEIPKLAAVPDIQPNQENTTSNATDAFDQLANAVSTSVNEENKGPSLEQLVAAPAAETTAPAAETTAQSIETSAPAVDPALASKSDEELLKEFENLLNSG